MNDLEVNCIQRPEPGAPHHLITHLGHRGFACRIPVELAIVQIRGNLSNFFMVDPLTRARVEIAVRREVGRCPYLQARVDGLWTEHLLALPECRLGWRLIRDGVMLETRQSARFLAPR